MAFASDVTAAEAMSGGYGVVTLVVVGELALSGRTQQL